MRILAIRGCNLASLAGEFEIDLSRAPFSDAGVFAIVGNTGAGKSTLLDALCVALFDRTPRLSNHSRVSVGRGEDDPNALGAHDVRTLLRRGAAQGWAEVDFESGDARRYRARWSVRRARGHVDGTLQDQQLTLTAIDGGERLGGTKTETLKAISARLGLTFDQFKRSALLAQGEFATFLRSEGKDRSELLERMTGTEIYTRLSVAAHVRATLAAQQLRDGRSAALAITVLDDTARAGIEVELALATDAKVVARARLGSAEAAARWRDEAARRAGQLAEAEAAHAAAQIALASSEAERTELALRRRAEPLRVSWDEVSRLERALAIAASEAAAADTIATTARESHHAIGIRRASLAEAHVPIRNARIAAQVVEHLATSTVPAEQLAAAAREDAGWLVARTALASEVASWNELDARFGQHGTLLDAIAGFERLLHEHAATRAKLVREKQATAADHVAVLAKLAEAQRKAASFHQRRGPTLDEAHRRENEARTRVLEVERLVRIAAGAREAIAVRDDVDRQLAEHAVARAADIDERSAIERDKTTAIAVRVERARIVDELRRAAGHHHARAELRAGQECPLCGATEHPWRDRGTFDDMIREAEVRLGDVASALDAATVALATLEARDQVSERERHRLARVRAASVDTAASAVAGWREQIAALGELPLVGDPSTAEAERVAGELEASANERLDQARLVFSQTQAATKAAQEAQAEVQLVQATVDRVLEVLTDHDRRIAELDGAIARANGELNGRRERHAELANELTATIARWRATLPRAAARRRTADAVVRSHDAVSIPDEIATARGPVAELAAAWRERAERVAIADGTLTAALAAIDRDAREAERAVTEHTARHADCVRRADALAIEARDAATRLDEACAAAGFDVESLRGLLCADPSRTDELAERLGSLERVADRERAVVAERRVRVDEHARSRPEDLADADIVETLTSAAADAEVRANHFDMLLSADREARARRAEALDALAAGEAAAEVHRILGDVIGSHDGKQFRSFAQSLTLDGLLAVANAHLDELAPRYQLERVPKHDLELQVIDRDLGAEVRSVQSLSGGESFLVSLALALGLSSMSAHDVRVRTLLIDEGFGTLDPATLDTALSVLDALQATGRQVGVISHVPALVERVGAHVRVVQRGGGKSEVLVS